MNLSEINIYPIKSCRGIPLTEARVEDRGLQFDRRWMLVDKNDWFMTQRKHPRMATIVVGVDGGELRVESEGFGRLTMPFEPDKGKRADVRVWRNRVRAVAYEDEVNEWFGEVLGTKCRLVAMTDLSHRAPGFHYRIRPTNEVSFADGYPFLLIGEGSLADINRRLAETHAKGHAAPIPLPIPMTRFRPNFVVPGTEPFEEDTWKRIRIGGTEFHVVKPCGRCVITTTDQITGERNGGDPLKTLAKYRTRRFGGSNKVLFGQNLIADKPGGTVRIGDKVEVLEYR